ncbi:MAG: lipid A deacylase LpxR family protein [Alphaproteobacteria bacterium]
MTMTATAQAGINPNDTADTKDNGRQIEIISENDLYGSGTDRYYTAGQRIVIDLKDDDPQWIKDGFAKLGFDRADRRVASLGQSIFTPDDITRDDHPPGSHPWAGWLGGSLGATQDRGDGSRESLELSIGVTGPASLAEKSQKFVHNTFDMTYPAGWHNQTRNEPHFNVTYARHWPGLGEWTPSSKFNLKASPYLLGTAGSWETSATSGVLVSIGSEGDIRTSRPAQVMPGQSPIAAPSTAKGKTGWNLYIGAQARAVGWNSAIDGNFWRNDGPPGADSEELVGEAYVGGGYRHKNVTIRGELVRRSKEFKQQEGDHKYGRISVSFPF